MATELEELKSELDKLMREVGTLRARVRKLEAANNGQPGLIQARGILKGADFTEEEIEAAKIRVRDID
jgi:hypothetical protein